MKPVRLQRRSRLLTSASGTVCAVFLHATLGQVPQVLLANTAHAQAAPPAGGVESVEKEHTVEAGDTLWDLSSRYLQNPWYWPKVWSYNPQITNPHFLFPGDKVKFFPGGEQQPARIAASSNREMDGALAQAGAPAPAATADAPVMPAEAGGATNTSNEMDLPPPPSDPNAGMAEGMESRSVSGNPGLGDEILGRSMIVQTFELLTPKELKEAGILERAQADKKMLSNYDVVYVRFTGEKPAVGGKVLFYRTVSEVEHPNTGDDVGFMTQISGTGTVLEGEGSHTAVQIDQTFDGIERGQLVAPQTEPLRRALTTAPNETKVEGSIITGEYYSRRILGQFHYVFVDRGTRDGVKNGNSFVVVHKGDEFADEDSPSFVVGKLVVVDAKETASMAIIVQSLRDLRTGDRIEMR